MTGSKVSRPSTNKVSRPTSKPASRPAQKPAARPESKPAAKPVAVVWDKRSRRPVAFTWRRRRYTVQRVLHTWVVDTGWWDDRVRVSRRYFRVRADGRTFDLAYDRRTRRWIMVATRG